MERGSGQADRDHRHPSNDAIPHALEMSDLSEKRASTPLGSTNTAERERKRRTLKEMNLREKVKHAASNITVEPLMIGYMVPYILSSITTLNLNLEKACRVNLNYSDTVCSAIAARDTANYTNETTAASTLVVDMNTWASALQGSGIAFLVLFAGSWSDRRHRRQPLAVSSIVGDLCTNLGLFLSAIFLLQWPLEVVAFIEAIFPAITGGYPFMSIACFAYISEITSEEDRTFRIGMFAIFTNLADPVATALSGYMHEALGYLGMFSLVSFLDILVVVYAVLNFKEPTPPVPRPPGVSFLADFFDWHHVKNTFSVALRDGPGNRRLRVILIIILNISIGGPVVGEYGNLFLYTLNKFQWTSEDFAFYSTYDIVVALTGIAVVSVVLVRQMKLSDCFVGIVGVLARTFAVPIFAFGNASWHMYAGKIVTILASGAGIGLSSLITKMVAPAELGQLMAFVAIVDAFIPVAFHPLYNTIFSHTLATFPGAFYLLYLAAAVISISCFLAIDKLQKQAKEEEKSTEEEKNMEEEKGESTSLGVPNLAFIEENEQNHIIHP